MSTVARIHANTRRWPATGGPALLSPEPPVAWSDYEALREMAQLMLTAREVAFPKRISSGELSADAAARELCAFRDLVSDWDFICTGTGEPASYGSEQARRDALDESLLRIAAHVERAGWTDQLHEKANQVIALRWHLEPGRGTIAMARMTHQLRASMRTEKGAQSNA